MSPHNWTPRVERLVMGWRDTAVKRANCCELEALWMQRQQRMLSMPQLVIGGTVGSLGFAGVSSAIFGVLGVVVAVLVALDNALQLSVRAHNKEVEARQLRNVATQIDVQMVRDRTAREEAQSFVDKIVIQFHPLRCTSSLSTVMPPSPSTTLHEPVVNCMMLLAPAQNSKDFISVPVPAQVGR